MIIAYTYSYICWEQFLFHINFVTKFQSFVQVHFGGPFICYHPVISPYHINKFLQAWSAVQSVRTESKLRRDRLIFCKNRRSQLKGCCPLSILHKVQSWVCVHKAVLTIEILKI